MKPPLKQKGKRKKVKGWGVITDVGFQYISNGFEVQPSVFITRDDARYYCKQCPTAKVVPVTITYHV